MVRSFSAGRSDSLTPLKTFLDSVAAVADFLHSFLNRWGKRFATLKEKTRIAKTKFSPIGCCNSDTTEFDSQAMSALDASIC